jgi:Fic family protein
MHAELPSLVSIVGAAPAQALARMHALVARGFADDSELGRPRSGDVIDDPLRLGAPASATEVAARLSDLSQVLVASSAPGILVAAVAHAEIASMRPFGWGSGLVARALPRLLLAQRGVDPGMLGAPEVGLKAAGRPAYVRAVRGYAQGSPEGVADMIRLVAAAVELGAQQPATWVAEG